MRTVACRTCGGIYPQPQPAEGHPYGWYQLTVSVPPSLGKRGKPFQWVGMYCSVPCLMGAETILREQASMAGLLYQREEAVQVL